VVAQGYEVFSGRSSFKTSTLSLQHDTLSRHCSSLELDIQRFGERSVYPVRLCVLAVRSNNCHIRLRSTGSSLNIQYRYLNKTRTALTLMLGFDTSAWLQTTDGLISSL
jgi:hypothetical protein